MTSGERDIVKEYFEARKFKRPPYVVEKARKDIVAELETYGIHPVSQGPVFIHFSPSSILITSSELGYMIYDNSKREGYRVVGDRLIISRVEPKSIVKEAIQLMRELKKGNVRYERDKHGRYGTVLLDIKNPRISHPLCIKLFNYAYPLTEERWKKSMANRFKPYYPNEGDWNLSGVTGIGSFVVQQELKRLEFEHLEFF